VRSPANFVHYLPPPLASDGASLVNLLIPPRRFGRCSGMGAKLAHAAASRDFYLFFFSLQTRACGLTRASKKSHFLRVAPIVSPFRPSIPIIPPPTRAPLPPTFIRRRVMHVLPGEGWGGGQRRCEGAEERDTMAMTTTTTTLPLLQTERTTSACAVEP
jgi:hypothetical protein